MARLDACGRFEPIAVMMDKRGPFRNRTFISLDLIRSEGPRARSPSVRFPSRDMLSPKAVSSRGVPKLRLPKVPSQVSRCTFRFGWLTSWNLTNVGSSVTRVRSKTMA